MKKNYIQLLLLLPLLFACSSLSAQWILVHSTPEVDVYEEMVTIDDTNSDVMWEYYNFRFVNKTSNTLELNWYFESHVDGVCTSCGMSDMGEFTATLVLNPSQTYDCDPTNQDDKRRVLAKRMVNKPGTSELTHHSIQDFTVTLL